MLICHGCVKVHLYNSLVPLMDDLFLMIIFLRGRKIILSIRKRISLIEKGSYYETDSVGDGMRNDR